MSSTNSDPSRAVVLLSGGIDSATCLAAAKAVGHEAHAISFDYGQRHKVELQCAARVARQLGAASHRVIPIDLRAIGGSALTADIDVPKDRAESTSDIPVTYVPARNLIFLSLASAVAEVVVARDIFIGINSVDYSGYPDCRQPFIDAFVRAANLATRVGVESHEGAGHFRIQTPLVTLTKAQILLMGARLGVDYGLTLSCYDPDAAGLACGHCDSCRIRAKGFADAGLADPTQYVTGGRP
ncbi:MAG: 7-cyano-7-deazaguanine synthase QueC [Planctomycetota bacterium]|nr:7-cyano-7-deazaguanine synthase QueC [Planctomycetota bacterium]